MVTNVLSYLERSAARFPDKVAFAGAGEAVSYRELARRAKAVGTRVARTGMRKRPVAVVTDHTVQCLVLFLGVAYSGNFYVPIDKKLPAARIAAILDVARPGAVIAPGDAAETVKGCVANWEKDGQPVFLAREGLADGPVDDALLAAIRRGHLDTDPLYLMFTSGSTGTPKGVLICHRSVIDLAEQFADVFGFDETDVFANQAPFDFDVSVKDLYCTLRNAASLVLVPQAMFSMPKKLVPFLNEHRVTTLIWAVSALQILSVLRVLDHALPETLKNVMFSGEVMPAKVLNDWRRHLPHVRYVNLYGPTEITCNCTYYVVDRAFSERESIPIGAAFPNTEILLLDGQGRPVPDGETGEICVRGTCLAHGYYRNPQATEAAFTQNPLNDAYPERIYHTGDYGRKNARGELLFAARRDWQIKHMGHRIELSEIENAANAIAGIEQCCCQYDEKRGKIVLVYQAREQMDAVVVKELQKYLPKYMCPNRLVHLDAIPRNTRGKIDRMAIRARVLS